MPSTPGWWWTSHTISDAPRPPEWGQKSRRAYLAGTPAQDSAVVGRLVYLIDTNIPLELLLDQEKTQEVEPLLGSLCDARLQKSELAQGAELCYNAHMTGAEARIPRDVK